MYQETLENIKKERGKRKIDLVWLQIFCGILTKEL